MKIGIEVEFTVLEPILQSTTERLGLVDEYYPFHKEFNNLLLNINSEDEIPQAYNTIKETVLYICKELSKAAQTVLTPYPMFLPENMSIIWNGVHIHYSANSIDKTISLIKDKNLIANDLISLHISKRPVSLRFLSSHHVWGGLRDSSFEHKKKQRYSPVNSTSIPTLELRYLDAYDLLDENYMSELMKKLLSYEKELNQPKQLNQSKILKNISMMPGDINYQFHKKLVDLIKTYSLKTNFSYKEIYEDENENEEIEYKIEYSIPFLIAQNSQITEKERKLSFVYTDSLSPVYP